MHQRGTLLEHIVTFITLTYPLTALPQLIDIWVYKRVEGVSMLTWGLFMIFTIPLILYCMQQRQHQLAIMWTLWLIMYVGIFTGLFIA